MWSERSQQSSGNGVILKKKWSWAVLKAVTMKIFGSARDENYVKMACPIKWNTTYNPYSIALYSFVLLFPSMSARSIWTCISLGKVKPNNYDDHNDIICLTDGVQEDGIMMTSSNGNIFRVTGPLCREFTGDRWIPRTKASGAALMFSFICAWKNGSVNNREAGDLRRHRAHYDVIAV